ncbi:MAG: hypothetical protein Kow0010_20240 [Dehalococcoidia bacterium]
MKTLRRGARRLGGWWPTMLEVCGIALVTTGLNEVYEPAALVFIGAVLVFVAQGMERRE